MNLAQGVRQPIAAIGLSHGASDEVGCQCFIPRHHFPNEDPGDRGASAFRSPLVSDGSAGEPRQRQHIGASRIVLASANGAGHPVDVDDLQSHCLVVCAAEGSLTTLARP